MKQSSHKRFGQSSLFFLICCYITLAGKASPVCWKNLWPPHTLGQPYSESPGGRQTGELQAPYSQPDVPHRVSPQQLVAVQHLHGSCCAFPSDHSCRSIAVCWGTELFLLQLCSAGHFLTKRRTADSTVTLTLASQQPKVLSTHTLGWTRCPSFDPQLLPLTLSNERKHSQLSQYIFFSYFSSSRVHIPPSLLILIFFYLSKDVNTSCRRLVSLSSGRVREILSTA